MPKQIYYVIEDAEIYSANGTSNLVNVGFPALTNFIGFAEKIRFNINKKQPNLITKSEISIISNEMELIDAHHSQLLYSYGSSLSDGINAPIVDNKLVNLNLNLYIKFILNDDNYINDDYSETFSFINDELLILKKDFKIAGGSLINFRSFLTKDINMVIKTTFAKKNSFILEKSKYDFNSLSENERADILNGHVENKNLLLVTGYSLIKKLDQKLFQYGKEFESYLGSPIFNFIRARKVYSYTFENQFNFIESFFSYEFKDQKIDTVFTQI